MTHYRLLLIATAALVLALSGVGVTLFKARAEDERRGPPGAPAVARELEGGDDPKADRPALVPPDKSGKVVTARDIHEALQALPKVKIEQATELPLSAWLEQFRAWGIPTFADDSFKRDPPIRLYGDESPRVKLPAMPGATAEQIIRAVFSQLSSEEPGELMITYKVQDGMLRLLRVPAESRGKPEDGQIITLHVEEKPLADVLRTLANRTGASVVLDVRQQDKAKTAVSGSFSDVRLMPALRVLCDMCDLQPVLVGGVFYVTSHENAERVLKEQAARRPDPAPTPKPKDAAEPMK